jgi:molecular chaperone GrpE
VTNADNEDKAPFEETPTEAAKASDESKEPSGVDLASELDNWKSRCAYLSAEIENMKKRALREKSEFLKHANEDLLKRMLPVVDNLEYALRAIKDAELKLENSLKSHPVYSNLVKGVEMTFKHFEQTLEGCGVQVVKAVGLAFDPNHHEAVGEAQNPDVADNNVVQEIQRGFSLYGRVLRPARVVVNRNNNEPQGPRA